MILLYLVWEYLKDSKKKIYNSFKKLEVIKLKKFFLKIVYIYYQQKKSYKIKIYIV